MKKVKDIAIAIFVVFTVLGNLYSYIQGNEKQKISYQPAVLQEVSEEKAKEKVLETSVSENTAEIKPLQNEEKDDKIDLNNATLEQLQTLKGIGPSKASAILDYKKAYGNFSSIEEIMQVKGIGEGIYNKIKDNIYVTK